MLVCQFANHNRFRIFSLLVQICNPLRPQFVTCYSVYKGSVHNLKYLSLSYKHLKSSQRYFSENGVDLDARQLRRQLKCSMKEAKKLLNDKIFQGQIDNVIARCELCEYYGISKEIILKYFWIVHFSSSELTEKFTLLEQLHFHEIASGIHLLKFDRKKLRFMTKLLVHETTVEPELKNTNRIIYLSTILQKDEILITELAYKCPFLLTMNFTKLRDALHMILSYGISPSHLYNDIWVVRFSLDSMKQRLDLLQSTFERSQLRPWMLHCGEEPFKRTIQLRDENRTALEPFENISEYLANRLEVNEEVINILKQKHPPLCKVQVYKLKVILDFLFAEGFSATQVCGAPRVLCHSLATLKERLMMLQSIGYRPNSLMTLCKTKKQFSELVRKLERPEKYLETNS